MNKSWTSNEQVISKSNLDMPHKFSNAYSSRTECPIEKGSPKLASQGPFWGPLGGPWRSMK